MSTRATARGLPENSHRASQGARRERKMPSTCQIPRQGDAVIGIGCIGAETGLGPGRVEDKRGTEDGG